MQSRIRFFHAPNSRSGGTRALLEELGVDYELHSLNLRKGEQREAAYTAINPMGKVPAICHGDVLVTEQAAIFLYLADLFPEAGLAPSLTDPLRGPYLRWMVYYNSCFEPALIDRSMKREPAPAATSPYGSWDDVYDTLTAQLAKGPYMLGERFSAVDVLWGLALNWMTMFKLVPETPAMRAFIERIVNRPAIKRASEQDAELAAAQQA